MIIASRGPNLWLSDRLGIINMARRSYYRIAIQSALKAGYWKKAKINDEGLEEAKQWEQKTLHRIRLRRRR